MWQSILKKDFFKCTACIGPFEPTSAVASCYKDVHDVRALLLLSPALAVLLVTYTYAKGGSPCCGQPGSAAHCGDGKNSSYPTYHPALTQTLGVDSLTPEILKPAASILRWKQILVLGRNLVFPPSQGATVRCCPTGTGAAGWYTLVQGDRTLAGCLEGTDAHGTGLGTP